MARPELGTKRVCPTTGRKFYDLNKTPIISPYTGQVVAIAAPLLRGGRAEVIPARPVVAPVPDDDVDADPVADVELVSLEDADEEATPSKAATGDDIEIEDDPVEDDTFLEEDEDEGDDVADLIGEGHEDDEER